MITRRGACTAAVADLNPSAGRHGAVAPAAGGATAGPASGGSGSVPAPGGRAHSAVEKGEVTGNSDKGHHPRSLEGAPYPQATRRHNQVASAKKSARLGKDRSAGAKKQARGRARTIAGSAALRMPKRDPLRSGPLARFGIRFRTPLVGTEGLHCPQCRAQRGGRPRQDEMAEHLCPAIPCQRVQRNKIRRQCRGQNRGFICVCPCAISGQIRGACRTPAWQDRNPAGLVFAEHRTGRRRHPDPAERRGLPCAQLSGFHGRDSGSPLRPCSIRRGQDPAGGAGGGVRRRNGSSMTTML